MEKRFEAIFYVGRKPVLLVLSSLVFEGLSNNDRLLVWPSAQWCVYERNITVCAIKADLNNCVKA